MYFHIIGAILLNFFLLQIAVCDELEEVFHWKQMSFANFDENDSTDFAFNDSGGKNIFNESFVSYHNLPMGVSHYKNKLYITVPRRRPGIPATLNVIDLNNVAKGDMSPAMTGYPDYVTNTIRKNYLGDSKRLISVYRTRIDICGRLWFVDTGSLEYPNNRRQIQRPSVWVIDLKTNRKVRRFDIPEEIVSEGFGMASITVDVDENNCDDAYAYIPDLAAYHLNVYSLRLNRMWQFKHNYLQNEPKNGDFDVAGVQFSWDDGIFSITLGKADPITNIKTVYFHAMASVSEYTTTNRVLQNETLALSQQYRTAFHFLGQRGPKTQSTIHHFDTDTGIMFYAEVDRNSIGCWNSRRPFTPETHGIVHLDNKRMIYPADLHVDFEGTLWVITNELPHWLYSHLDLNNFSYRIWRQTVKKAVAGTICDLIY